MATSLLTMKNDYDDQATISADWLNDAANYLNTVALLPASASLSAGAEAANAIAVTVQLKNVLNANLAERRLLRVIVADSEFGAECSSAPDGGVAVTTGTLLQTITSGKQLIVQTDATGLALITLTHAAGAKTVWLRVFVADRPAAVQVVFA